MPLSGKIKKNDRKKAYWSQLVSFEMWLRNLSINFVKQLIKWYTITCFTTALAFFIRIYEIFNKWFFTEHINVHQPSNPNKFRASYWYFRYKSMRDGFLFDCVVMSVTGVQFFASREFFGGIEPIFARRQSRDSPRATAAQKPRAEKLSPWPNEREHSHAK